MLSTCWPGSWPNRSGLAVGRLQPGGDRDLAGRACGTWGELLAAPVCGEEAPGDQQHALLGTQRGDHQVADVAVDGLAAQQGLLGRQVVAGGGDRPELLGLAVRGGGRGRPEHAADVGRDVPVVGAQVVVGRPLLLEPGDLPGAGGDADEGDQHHQPEQPQVAGLAQRREHDDHSTSRAADRYPGAAGTLIRVGRRQRGA